MSETLQWIAGSITCLAIGAVLGWWLVRSGRRA
jgi:hypothetical protein